MDHQRQINTNGLLTQINTNGLDFYFENCCLWNFAICEHSKLEGGPNVREWALSGFIRRPIFYK